MKTFKKFIFEKYIGFDINDSNILDIDSKQIEKFMNDLNEMNDHDLIFRGFKDENNNNIILSSSFKNKDHSWYGTEKSNNVKDRAGEIMKKIIFNNFNIKNPVFASNDLSKAKYFNNPYIFIPRKSANYYYSKEIKDLLLYLSSTYKINIKDEKEINKSDEELKEKTYKKYINSKIPPSDCEEIIIDCKEYWLLNSKLINQITKKNKNLKKMKYSDIYKIFKKYLKVKNENI